MLVLLTGVFGVLRMQVMSMQLTHDALHRMQALHLASSVLESLRRNPAAAARYLTAPGASAGIPILGAEESVLTCGVSAPCRLEDLAASDLYRWQRQLLGGFPEDKASKPGRPLLPSGELRISARSDIYTVAVSWAAPSRLGDAVLEGRVPDLFAGREVRLHARIAP